jgi:hypothetical protein
MAEKKAASTSFDLFAPAPVPKSADAIELTPLLGKAVAIRALDRYEVDTKFGKKPLTQVQMVVAGEAEPLEGVIFQAYFQSLPLTQWFAGVICRNEKGHWGMDHTGLKPADSKALAGVVSLLPSIEDVPFG